MKELNEYETPGTDAHYTEIMGTSAKAEGRAPNKMRSLEQRLAACHDALEQLCNATEWPTPKQNRDAILKNAREVLEITKNQ